MIVNNISLFKLPKDDMFKGAQSLHRACSEVAQGPKSIETYACITKILQKPEVGPKSTVFFFGLVRKADNSLYFIQICLNL